MKITSVEVLVHERPSPFGGAATVPFVVMTVKTDVGVEGTTFVNGPWGSAPTNARLLVDMVRPALIGKDPLDIGVIWTMLWKMRRKIGLGLVGAVDVALWDILGRVAGLPVHRLLGTARHEIPVYVSSWIHRHPEDYVAEALHYQAQGITAYKLHPPTARRDMFGEPASIDEDIAAVRAVREAVGPSMTLMSDSPNTYTYEEALKMGFALQDYGYHWYEDPLPADDIQGYLRLRQQLHIPILATEMTDGGPYGFAEWLTNRATDYLRGDVCFKGGISAVTRIAHTAEVFRLNFETHDGFNAMNNMAGLNIIMSLRNTRYFEMLTLQETGVYGFQNMGYGLTEPFTVDAAGMIAAPTGPGLGAEIDWELIRSRAVAVG